MINMSGIFSIKAKTAFVVILAFGTVSNGFAEQRNHQKSEVAKLSFLVGKWSGPGTSYAEDGSTSTYHDVEHVRFDLDQNLLLINAHGEKDGEKTYQLHTVIYYDPVAKHYWYTPYTGKRARRFACELATQKFLCLNEDKNFRLTFQRLNDGTWNEFGERLKQGNWSKTFETRLSAKNK